MSKQLPTNIAASVRQRLLNHARATQTDYNLIEVRYAIERLLYRLSVSAHRESFLLKGAMLFVLWDGESHRPTRDLDLLLSPAQSVPQIEDIFRSVVQIPCPEDGLRFDYGSISATEIRGNDAYGGIRVALNANLGSGRFSIQVDIGLGDAVIPAANWAEYPSLLDLPRPTLRAYPVYTVVAEKVEVIAVLGVMNSRMKDYYDLLYLQNRFEFDGSLLQKAILATFKRRGTPLPTELLQGLSESFFASPNKTKQWQSFMRKNHLDSPALPASVNCIAEFVMPVFTDPQISELKWIPKKGWSADAAPQ